jgi:hypothetical protein
MSVLPPRLAISPDNRTLLPPTSIATIPFQFEESGIKYLRDLFS